MKITRDSRRHSERNGFSREASDAPEFATDEVAGRKGPASEEATLERHYTVKEVAEMWHLDEKMIRRIFGDEPGVVSIGSNESRFRRAYRTLRIPESVLVRVHRRLRRAG